LTCANAARRFILTSEGRAFVTDAADPGWRAISLPEAPAALSG
jgi:hypothetical protein